MAKRKVTRSPRRDATPRRSTKGDGSEPPPGGLWLHGHHPVMAALDNPRRHRHELWASEAMIPVLLARYPNARPRPATRVELDHLLGPGAIHQGLALRVEPLPDPGLDSIADAGVPDRLVVVLDQVTDPQNVGALLRGAAAFGAVAVIMTKRNAPPESGALAKAASGALDMVPIIRVTNLARALDTLGEAGFTRIGLADEATTDLAGVRPAGPAALVLGSEGAGMRRLTRERCDTLVRLPTTGAMRHLNVSAAAAVALYALVTGAKGLGDRV